MILLNQLKKKNSLSPIKIVYPVHPKPQTKIDYLSEMRIEKEKKKGKQKNMKRNALSNQKNDSDFNEQAFNSERWEKVVNSDMGNLLQNINLVKEKAKIMEDEVKQKRTNFKI